jgi:mono/diheme cytochrome c family protein
MRGRRPITMLALVVLLTGCGGSQPRRSAGAAVFARNCSLCHSLVGNESLRRQGGDLLGYRLTRAQLLQITREMPVRRPLTGAELAAVVDYVLRAQRSAARQ